MSVHPLAPDVAVASRGLLRTFSELGALTWADVHPALHLCHLYGEIDERVQLALALTVRALRAGSMCVDLSAVPEQHGFGDEEGEVTVPTGTWPQPLGWLEAVRTSPVVTLGEAEPVRPRPLRFVDGLLYLERYWQDQELVRRCLLERLAAPNSTTDGAAGLDGQGLAVAAALTRPLTVIAGGPGTGKTTVIARIIRQLNGQGGDAERPPMIGLAAPTGKAAARMTESLVDQGLPGYTALTLHRFLGWKPGSRSRFQHHRDNPLPHDVVIIDELSMVSMTLMARMLSALKPGARLVLVGDPDQLASVEAGAVLADITRAPALQPVVVRLTQNWRFQGAIQTLASAIRDGDADQALVVLKSDDPAVALLDPDQARPLLRDRCVLAGRALLNAANADDGPAALQSLDSHRLLCAHRAGQFGVQHWVQTVQGWLVDDVAGYVAGPGFHPGQPVMMTRNAPDLGLYNGDTGVILGSSDDAAGARALFATGLGPRTYSPYVLDGLEPIDAMTIHKSQGSQFDHVSVILPPESSPLLTRELLYTAVTRASRQVLLVGSPDSLRAAIDRPAARTSGLTGRL